MGFCFLFAPHTKPYRVPKIQVVLWEPLVYTVTKFSLSWWRILRCVFFSASWHPSPRGIWNFISKAGSVTPTQPEDPERMLTFPTAVVTDQCVILSQRIGFVEDGVPPDGLLEAELWVAFYNHTTFQDLWKGKWGQGREINEQITKRYIHFLLFKVLWAHRGIFQTTTLPPQDF